MICRGALVGGLECAAEMVSLSPSRVERGLCGLGKGEGWRRDKDTCIGVFLGVQLLGVVMMKMVG